MHIELKWNLEAATPRSTDFDTEYYQPTEAEIGRVREAHAVIQRLNQLGAPAMI